MNPLLVKQTAILSSILGGIIGVLTLIPFIRNFSFLILLICVSAIILVYMKKHNLIGVLDLKEGAVLGGIIGFVAVVAFSVVFIPLIALVGAIFKGTYNAYLFSMFKMMGVVVTGMLIFFIALLGALMNAFAGLTTAYVYEILSGMKKEQNENIDFEIKE